MAERVQENPKPIKARQLERWSLFGSILIWIGVLAFGIGLTATLRNQRLERLQYARLLTSTAVAADATPATPTSTLTLAPPLFPAGWSTATPTPVGFVRIPVASPTSTVDRQAGTAGTERATPSPRSTPQPTPAPAKPPDRLVIPRIGLDSPIVPIGWSVVEQDGIIAREWEVADYKVGWHETSSYPGRIGNTVLNGHHNIKGEVFRYLVDLEPGDQVYVYAEDQRYTYVVTEKHILKEKGQPLDVRRANAKWIERTVDERLTMITCWPYTNNTHRLVVVAKPLPVPSAQGVQE